MWSSVSSYGFVGSAEALSGSLNREAKDMAVAVFYDPNYSFGSPEAQQIIRGNKGDYAAMEDKLRELAREDLRAQVSDFLSWLKAPGII